MSFLTYRFDLNDLAIRKVPTNDLFTVSKSASVLPVANNVQLERLLTVPVESKKEPSCLQSFAAKFFYEYDVNAGILGHANNSNFQTYVPTYPPFTQSNWTVCKQDRGFVFYTTMNDSSGSHWRADIINKTVHLESNTTELDSNDIFQVKDGQISPLNDEHIIVQYDPVNHSPVGSLPLTSDLNDPNTRFKITVETLDFTVMVNN